MDAVEKANTERQKRWSISISSVRSVCLTFIFKDQRPEGWGGYICRRLSRPVLLHSCKLCGADMLQSGREASTGRKVAIKKIKVGQFKDGLDMSAIREVKYLRELQHHNVIEVSSYLSRLFATLILRYKLLDVFSSKTNLNLVLEFLDSDLEMIIKDRALVFLPADIKSWIAMTFRGLEYCHRNFILHRVNKQT